MLTHDDHDAYRQRLILSIGYALVGGGLWLAAGRCHAAGNDVGCTVCGWLSLVASAVSLLIGGNPPKGTS